jgi:hypothetical protein
VGIEQLEHMALVPRDRTTVKFVMPSPRSHQIRFHGVLTANADLRSNIVPAPAERPPEPQNDYDPDHGETPCLTYLGCSIWSSTSTLRLPSLRRRSEVHRRPYVKLATRIGNPLAIVNFIGHLAPPTPPS